MYLQHRIQGMLSGTLFLCVGEHVHTYIYGLLHSFDKGAGMTAQACTAQVRLEIIIYLMSTIIKFGTKLSLLH